MPKAIWNGAVIAESEATEIVEDNHYFAPETINQQYFKPHDRRTRCSWKGEARYFSLSAGGQTAEAAAWYYPEPKEAAKRIQNYVAFGNGVEIQE